MIKKALYQVFTNTKANSECGTMVHDNNITKTTFGIISGWYPPNNTEWLESNQDKIKWNIKKVLHKYFKTNFILIDIDYAKSSTLMNKSKRTGLSFIKIEFTTSHQPNINFVENISTYEQINNEIIDYLYTIPLEFQLKGLRKPRKKYSETLKVKSTTYITQVENVS